MILLQDIGDAVAESATDATEMATGNLFDMPWLDPHSLGEMAMRFLFTLIVTLVMVYCLYYRRSKRREYFFTYILLSLSVFFLIYLLGSVKVKIGFALGLFAIFGILRYRTDTIPVREMTYMFSVIAISVVNALARQNYCSPTWWCCWPHGCLSALCSATTRSPNWCFTTAWNSSPPIGATT